MSKLALKRLKTTKKLPKMAKNGQKMAKSDPKKISEKKILPPKYIPYQYIFFRTLI